MRVRTLGSFNAAFCREIEPPLANLYALIGECDRQGLTGWPAVESARAVYEDISGYVIYIPLVGKDCERHLKEVDAAIAKLRVVLAAIPGASLSVPRPDAVAPDGGYGLPLWVKVAGFGLLGVLTLKYLSQLGVGRRYAEWEPEDTLD